MPTLLPAHSQAKTHRAQPRTLLSLAVAAALGAAAPLPALAQTGAAAPPTAQTSQQRQFNIPGGALDAVLNHFALDAGIELAVSSDLTQGKTSAGLQGQYSVEQALSTLLEGSGLSYRFNHYRNVALESAVSTSATQLPNILVRSSVPWGADDPHSDENKRLNSLRPDLILSGDTMRRFPDEHVGKALDRLPGMFSTSPSEKQEVRVRGLDKEFTRIEVGGVNVPGGNRWRNLSLGSVASSLVDEVRVIRNPTADIEHDGIGGRVSIRYRRAPEEFEGHAQILGGTVDEGEGRNMFAGRASIWAGGPVHEGFGLLGGLDVSAMPSRREHQATQTNADGSFREQFDRTDRKEVSRLNAFSKFGWVLEDTYLELEPMVMAHTSNAQDTRYTLSANGNEDNRFFTSDDYSFTSGINLRWEHALTPHWQLEGRASGFHSNQQSITDEVRLRYQNASLHRHDISRTTENLTDDLLEVRNALFYEWQSDLMGKSEIGLQVRRNQRDGDKTQLENGNLQDASSGDIYTLTEDYRALWLRQQFRLLDGGVRLEPGVRLEDYSLSALSNDRDGSTRRQGSDNFHFGPSLHAAWQLNSELTLQGAISRTQNRPQLDQITPSTRQRGSEIIVGNPDLDSSTSINTDLGLVWVTSDTFFAMTAFHKDIDDLIVNSRTGEREGNRDLVQPINIEHGTLRGVELEQRVHLGLTGLDWLEGFHIWSNQTWFDGRMRLQSGREVPFFGEPDYLVAAGVDWINPRSDMRIALAVNHNGKRTEEDENSRKRFDPLTTVDLTLSYPLAESTRLKLEASNLFNEQESGPKQFFNAAGELEYTENRTVTIPRIFWLGVDVRF